MLSLLLIACSGTKTISGGGDDSGAGGGPVGDSGSDSAEPLRDLDEDGSPAGEDCMDLNAAVHPGAEELWNQLDDDCDGRFDADGSWAGTIAVDAQAVYEGQRYNFRLSCPMAGERASGTFDWLVSCTSDPDDDKAQLLLGASFTLRPKDGGVELDRWEGDTILESSGGWDTDTDGSVEWSSFDRASFAASLSAASLAMSASGTITRQ